MQGRRRKKASKLGILKRIFPFLRVIAGWQDFFTFLRQWVRAKWIRKRLHLIFFSSFGFPYSIVWEVGVCIISATISAFSSDVDILRLARNCAKKRWGHLHSVSSSSSSSSYMVRRTKSQEEEEATLRHLASLRLPRYEIQQFFGYEILKRSYVATSSAAIVNSSLSIFFELSVGIWRFCIEARADTFALAASFTKNRHEKNKPPLNPQRMLFWPWVRIILPAKTPLFCLSDLPTQNFPRVFLVASRQPLHAWAHSCLFRRALRIFCVVRTLLKCRSPSH